jgi:hypothetical protein
MSKSIEMSGVLELMFRLRAARNSIRHPQESPHLNLHADPRILN